MTDHYAVIGNPIAHSKSPDIHAAFARQTGQHIEYGRILGHLDDFADDVRRFVAEGGRGLSVTVPFKEQAWRLLADRSPRAEAAGAVNTLVVLDGGMLHGDNTDGVGLVRDLAANHGFQFDDKRVLLLGAGGAARGVLRPLLECDPAELLIANRTASKAETLASLADGGWTYDMFYGDEPTPFCRWASSHGAARALDGLGMLVEQAAEAFTLWRGVRPNAVPVIELLRGGGSR